MHILILLIWLAIAIAPVSWAATTTVLTAKNYAAGTYSFGPISIPTGISLVTITVDMSQVSTLTGVYTYNFEISQDGGVTWAPGGSGTLSVPNSGLILDAGVLSFSVGNPVPNSGFTITLPNPTNANRKARGTVVLNESLKTSVTVTTQ